MEKKTEVKYLLNGTWKFQPIRTEGIELSEPASEWSDVPIIVPSFWNGNMWDYADKRHVDTTYHCDGIYYPDYPEEWSTTEKGWLCREFEYKKNAGKRVILHFDAVAGYADIYINRKKIGEHFDSWMCFEYDITDSIKDGKNEILVGIRNAQLFNINSPTYKRMFAPYPAGSFTGGACGIWQDVWVEEVEAVRVTDLFAQPFVDRGLLCFELTIHNDTATNCETVPSVIIRETGYEVKGDSITVEAGESKKILLQCCDTDNLELWSPDTPVLYNADAALNGIHSYSVRFGWRQFKIDGELLRLNGDEIHLVGDFCHPFGLYMYKPEWIRSWYKLLKNAGANAVRLHAQVYPSVFLDLADEMGLCVLDETAFFGSNIINNLEEEIFWERVNVHYDSLIIRDRNHPSVFGWSFGNELFALFLIDEAAVRDQDKFYPRIIEYGKRSYALDPTRDFITCDGDEDLRGSCPVWSKHYGHGNRELPKINKPKVIGEDGGTYYATPSDLSMFNGESAYISYAGRNNALGIDLYNQYKFIGKDLALFSPTEVVWYGLEPLPYGYRDYSRLPELDDGIFFDKPEDGTPGLWIGRIPPFAGTLNPGWDPLLEEYRPLDMYEAFKDALADDSCYDKKWAYRVTELPAPPVYETKRTVRFDGDQNGRCAELLRHMGLVLSENGDDMIVDGDTASEPVEKSNGITLVMLRDNIPSWLSVSFTDRTATQLVREHKHPWIDSISTADMYTAETKKCKYIIRHGIVSEDAEVLLKAGEADWSQFNNISERVKCSAAFLYEHLEKENGSALIHLENNCYVTSILTEPTEQHFNFWRKLFSNIGWELTEPTSVGESEAKIHDLLLNGPVN